VKEADFQNANIAVMSTTEKKPWSNFESSKQFKPKKLHKKSYQNYYKGFKTLFKCRFN